MPSRKKNKGKERKAKKAELEAESRAVVRSVWVKYARGVDEDGGIITQCNHGVDLVIPEDKNHPVTKFIDAFYSRNSSDNFRMTSVTQYLIDTFATHQELWDNEKYREMTANIFFAIGTNGLVAGGTRFNVATIPAHAIVVLENYDGIGIISTLNSRVAITKLRDISGSSSDRDLLKFYRKRTTCKCLKRMHSEARKTQPKTGMCFHCKQRKERALFMVCSRCTVAQFCSRECQIAGWPRHKKYCDKWACDLIDAQEQQTKKR